MSYTLKMMLLAAALSLPTLSFGKQCEFSVGSSAEEITSYLQHGDSATAECVQVAFHRIGALPTQQAIPLLIHRISE